MLAVGGCGAPSSAADPRPAAEAGAARLLAPRAAHAAVALADGRVLFLGGCTEASCESGPAGELVEAFDPRTMRVSAVGRLAPPRTGATVVALANGRVLVAGGWAGPQVTDAVEVFDPATGRSRRVGALAQARADMASVTLADGRVLLAGGYNSGASGVVELFDPRTGTLTRLPPLLTPRAGAMSVPVNGGILIVGGGEGASSDLRPSAAAELYSVTGGSRRVADLAHARYKHAAAPIAGGRAAVIGGSDARDNRGKLTAVEIFNPASGRFESGGELLEARYKIGAAVVTLPDGRVFVGGGGTRPEVYDPALRRGAALGGPVGEPLNFSTATLLRDGRVLVAGGYTEAGIRPVDALAIHAP